MNAYRRTRRFAYASAGASVVLLALWILFGGLPDAYRSPVLLRTEPEILVLHDAIRGEQEDVVQYLLAADPDTLQPSGHVALFGDATAAAAGPEGTVVFYGRRWSLPDREDAGSRELPGAWPVQAATADPSGLWLFGSDETALRTRRLENGEAGPEETVADAGSHVEKIVATWSPGAGPTVVWKERDRSRLRIHRRTDGAWTPWDEVDIGDSPLWTTVQLGDRQLVLWMARGDRFWRSVAFRVACCSACRRSPPPSLWTFRDPLWIGRTVSGLSVLPAGDLICLCVSRTSAIQIAFVPVGTGPDGRPSPPPDARLASVPLEPAWRRGVALFFPAVMLLLAVSLVYFGFELMRERRRLILAALGAVEPPGPRPADVLQRVMAAIIDLMILMPFQLLLVELTDLLPTGPEILVNPDTFRVISIAWAIHFLYFFGLEWLNRGQTLGKRIVGIRVVRAHGGAPSAWNILGRTLGRIPDIYLATPGIGLICMLLTRRRRRIGDLLGRTVVVQSAIERESPLSGPTLQEILDRAEKPPEDSGRA